MPFRFPLLQPFDSLRCWTCGCINCRHPLVLPPTQGLRHQRPSCASRSSFSSSFMGLLWILTSSSIHSLIGIHAFNYHACSDKPQIEIPNPNFPLPFEIGPHLYNFSLDILIWILCWPPNSKYPTWKSLFFFPCPTPVSCCISYLGNDTTI